MRAALKELIARTSAARFASGARHARTIVAFTRQRTPACFASHSRVAIAQAAGRHACGGGRAAGAAAGPSGARASAGAARHLSASSFAVGDGDGDGDDEDEVEIDVEEDIDGDEDDGDGEDGALDGDDDEEDDEPVYPPSPRDRAHEILQVDEHGDSIYVRERRAYRRQVSALRKQYAAEHAENERRAHEAQQQRRLEREDRDRRRGRRARRRHRQRAEAGSGDRDDMPLLQEEKEAQLRLIKGEWKRGARAASARRQRRRDERRAAAALAADALPLAAEADGWIGVLEHEMFKVYQRRHEDGKAAGDAAGVAKAAKALRDQRAFFARRAAQLLEESSWKAMGVPAHLRVEAQAFVEQERREAAEKKRAAQEARERRKAAADARGEPFNEEDPEKGLPAEVEPLTKAGAENLLQRMIADGEGPPGYGDIPWNQDADDQAEKDDRKRRLPTFALERGEFVPDARLVLDAETKRRVRATLGWLPVDPEEAIAAANAAAEEDEAAAALAAAEAEAEAEAAREAEEAARAAGPPRLGPEEVRAMPIEELLALAEGAEDAGVDLGQFMEEDAIIATAEVVKGWIKRQDALPRPPFYI